VKLAATNGSLYYAYGIGGAIATQAGSGAFSTRVLLKDLHGDVIGSTSSAGAVESTRTIDALGRAANDVRPERGGDRLGNESRLPGRPHSHRYPTSDSCRGHQVMCLVPPDA
jgi:hypothetical protein